MQHPQPRHTPFASRDPVAAAAGALPGQRSAHAATGCCSTDINVTVSITADDFNVTVITTAIPITSTTTTTARSMPV
jgi:hypothetical protein